jgi:hypothetical protein
MEAVVTDRRDSGRKGTRSSAAEAGQAEGLWVQLPGESYWFYVRHDAGRRRFTIFDRGEP